MQPIAHTPDLQNRLMLAERANAESQALLRKILPDFVIARLMAAPEVSIADHFADASVLFADIQGFVAIAKRLGNARTVALLDHLTREFDALALCHGVEKIKTIGDGYMAVAGVPHPQPDHCERLARLALDMQAVAQVVGEAFGITVTLRIGIAAGAVTAGVIGVHKVAYDVWGDAVNLAARLEGLARGGQILISAEARSQLEGRFKFGKTRRVAVRGLGIEDACPLGRALSSAEYVH
jgi:adenylate cyclase